VVDRSTRATDWIDGVETGWTGPHFTELGRMRKNIPSPCQGQVARNLYAGLGYKESAITMRKELGDPDRRLRKKLLP
jgi:hypothetical protein